MSTAKVRIVNGGPTGLQSHVWIDGWHVPAVRSVVIEESVDDVHRVTVTVLATEVTVEHQQEGEATK